MEKQYDKKPGTFTIFKNENKTSDKSPDYSGAGKLLDGTPARAALWVKIAQSGRKYLSMTITEIQSEEGRLVNGARQIEAQQQVQHVQRPPQPTQPVMTAEEIAPQECMDLPF